MGAICEFASWSRSNQDSQISMWLVALAFTLYVQVRAIVINNKILSPKLYINVIRFLVTYGASLSCLWLVYQISPPLKSFIETWVILSVASAIFLLLLSGGCFVALYGRPTYEAWQYKINPEYPSPHKIKEEIIVMCQGMCYSTLCPSLSIFLTQNNIGYGYCGVDESNGGYSRITKSLFLIWIITDFYEFLYHWLGHKVPLMWKLHSEHHHFYNPTPFAVVADSPLDQFLRAAPILVLPLLFPVNLDLIFNMFSILFYLNGLIQHSGYESKWLDYIGIDGHSKWFLTSYHHYLHHAKSFMNTPLYNGQLLQLWDRLFGCIALSNQEKACSCSKCARRLGLRTLQHFKQIKLPDYKVLLTGSFWLSNDLEEVNRNSLKSD